MKTILGARIRKRRRELDVTQANLADRIGISSSYLNLIEHNKRRVSGKLLHKIAQALNLDLEDLDGAVERRLLSRLDEIADLPEFAHIGVESERTGELIGRYPGWARAVAALARSERESTEIARALADRLTHDTFLGDSVHKILSGIASVRSSGEILVHFPDMETEQRDQFNRIIYDECQNLTSVGEALATYFDKSDEAERVLTPQDEVETFFESRANHFAEIEAAADAVKLSTDSAYAGTRKQLAAAIVEREFGDLIKSLLENGAHFETEIAHTKAREALVEYAVEAILVPMQRFESAALESAFDIEFLAESFAVEMRTICHRLTALPRRREFPRFGHYLTNAAGTIISMRSLQGLLSPRYAAACPLWVLYRAQQSPETVLRQRALFPSGRQYVFLARARHRGQTGFGQPRHYVTDMLALTEEDAAKTVYAPADNVPVERVGATCRSCPRESCDHRVADPLTG
ncbi:MAG: short-chain fatty acyl-CoA regulator family protein [Pseudomonadota bacterium]